jgi:putative molybdopterin biosynthesis protein
MRKRYLARKPLDEALRLFLSHPACSRLSPPERIATWDSIGRVTAEPVYALISSPPYHCAAMDGISLKASDTFGASDANPVRIPPDRYRQIDTGDPIPEEHDAVVMAEEIRELDEGWVEIRSAARPWQHVRMAGEDVVATEMILPRGHRIRPVDVSAMLSCGVRSVAVRSLPSVAVIPTGDELVSAEEDLSLEELYGKVIETNSYMLAGMIREWGGEPVRFKPVPDDREAIRRVIQRAAEEFDLIAINAGSSAGRGDYVPQIISEIGELLVHGVEIMPGKPVALGIVCDKPIIGVPGYPVSAYVAFDLFAKPLISRMLGIATPQPQLVGARTGRRVASRAGTEEFIRARLGRIGSELVAVPIARGAGVISSLVRADGIVRISADLEGIEQGEMVRVELLRRMDEIENTISIVGSHDMTLDLIGDEMRRRWPGIGVASAHVGSLAGLAALRRGECHAAGTHLMDEETGEYNVSYVRRLFPEGGIALINLVYRQQGLIVRKGNPKGIESFEDLTRDGVRFVNRQPGSGTRVLLDYELRRHGISPEEIEGYENELFTHLAIAAAVRDGVADAGLGIMAAAKALDLDFIPVAEERYDLAIPERLLEGPLIARMLETIRSDEFKRRVRGLGGYDTRHTGERML